MSAIAEASNSVFGTDIDLVFDRLVQIEGKAEIVDGKIVVTPLKGAWPDHTAGEIYASLRDWTHRTKRGQAIGGSAIFRVHLPNRDSFCPDAAYHVGPSGKMKPYEGSPLFAVEIRTLGDYGPRSDRFVTDRRTDYFAAGALVVWDVDLLSNDVVQVYRATAPETPTIYRPGDIAEAEPAVPGWTVAVNELLPDDWEPSRSQASN
ncbi:MAG TPA: Uma2 family endonuclease [Planctomycetaceae bacterium]|nr:Uma2 family endonuclease [Planctomycetaceae bacterium]